MNDPGFSGALKRREEEQRKRIVAAASKKQADEAAKQRAGVHAEDLAAAAKERALRETYAQLVEAGASDGGVKFETVLRVGSFSDRAFGDRVILPVEVLSALSAVEGFPWMFELVSGAFTRHCGVLEFTAASGEILVDPKLGLKPDQSVRLRYKQLSKCTAVSLRVSALLVENFPDLKSLLEAALRAYCAVTVGDVLRVANEPVLVVRVEPDPACSLIDTDVSVELEVIQHGGQTRWTVGESAVVDGSKRLFLPLSSVQNDGNLVLTSETSDTFLIVSEPTGKVLFGGFIDEAVRIVDCGGAGFVVLEAEGQRIGTQWETSTSEGTVCRNCGGIVPPASMELHSVRCLKMVQMCQICQKPVSRGKDHVHCSQCGMGYDPTQEHQHTLKHHSLVACICGTSVARFKLAQHRNTECEFRLLPCRFCGLAFPRGDISHMDARDRFMGFVSNHEAQCGNRTDQCTQCGKRERLKDMQIHVQAFHDNIIKT